MSADVFILVTRVVIEVRQQSAQNSDCLFVVWFGHFSKGVLGRMIVNQANISINIDKCFWITSCVSKK